MPRQSWLDQLLVRYVWPGPRQFLCDSQAQIFLDINGLVVEEIVVYGRRLISNYKMVRLKGNYQMADQ